MYPRHTHTTPQPPQPPRLASQSRLEWFPLACFVCGLVFCLIFRAGKQLCPPRPRATLRIGRTLGWLRGREEELLQQTGRIQGSLDLLSKTRWLGYCCCCAVLAIRLSLCVQVSNSQENQLSAWVRCLQPGLFSSPSSSLSPLSSSLFSPLFLLPFSLAVLMYSRMASLIYLLTPLVAQDDLELVILLPLPPWS